MDILGGLFVLVIIAAVGLWQSPSLLMSIEAKCFARRAGLKAQREAFTAHLSRLRTEQ